MAQSSEARMFKWNPFADMEAAREHMDRLWREACPEGGCAWSPAADVLETPSAYVLRVELPGLSLPAVSVEVRGRELAISGRRDAERDEPGVVYLMLERAQGAFVRRFALPPDADDQAITASLKDGLLCVTIPRKAATPGLTLG
jgi:HSP20 family protein